MATGRSDQRAAAVRARRVLVAGIGNVFLGDAGFGTEVVGRVDRAALPAGVEVADYGIRGLHLAYELLSGRHDTLIMVDAVPLDGPPGTLAVLDRDVIEKMEPADGRVVGPQAVLHLLRTLGGWVEEVLVVGCRPAVIEDRVGLSEPVGAAVDEAVRMVADLVRARSA